jgi:hypothetical protein
MVATRDEVHALVDALPESELRTAQRFLRYLWWESDDALATLLRSAPVDDESVTEEEEAGAAEARAEIAGGDVISAEDVKRLLLP